MNSIIFGHITVGMAISFVLSIAGLFLFRAILVKENEDNKGYGVGRFMKPTALNVAFHLVTSFLFLFLLHEVSEVVIKRFIPELDSNNTFHNTLSAFSGVFGGYAFAWIFEKGRKRLNTKDENIKHIHDENCKH
ncbi:MAG: hypothetical protein HKN40_00010 [Winogradskyella sp.]|uniref:hypothetical protein n=1 Tax=Winogradskyella sp. TaxID=1883156 RepID=UPI00183FEBD0|nr:hypothetical protein [Winogradskyella sp.]